MSPESEAIQGAAAEFIRDRHRLGVFIGGLLRGSHAAEDVIQEVWVQLAKEVAKAGKTLVNDWFLEATLPDALPSTSDSTQFRAPQNMPPITSSALDGRTDAATPVQFFVPSIFFRENSTTSTTP